MNIIFDTKVKRPIDSQKVHVQHIFKIRPFQTSHHEYKLAGTAMNVNARIPVRMAEKIKSLVQNNTTNIRS